MDVTLLGEVTTEQWSELVNSEPGAWGAEAEALHWRDKQRHVGVLTPEGRLLAFAGSLIAEVQVGGSALTVLGIGGVFVHPNVRGQGLVGRMLALLMPAGEEPPADRAMLFCRPPLTGLYEPLGFRELEQPVSVAQPDGRVEMPLRTMWRPLRDGVVWPAGPVSLPGLPF
jgi:predicted GNAT family N-acyltransferase